MTVQEIFDFLDKYDLSGTWDGGNDSGGWNIDFENPISKKDIDKKDEVMTWINSEIEEKLDYGSWAGNFSSSGDISYNNGDKEIHLDGYYTNEEDSVEIGTEEIDLSILRPFGKFIDCCKLNISNYGDEQFEIVVSNGPWLPEYEEAQDIILKQLEKSSEKYIEGQNYFLDQVYTADDLINHDYSIIFSIGEYEECKVTHSINLRDYED